MYVRLTDGFRVGWGSMQKLDTALACMMTAVDYERKASKVRCSLSPGLLLDGEFC